MCRVECTNTIYKQSSCNLMTIITRLPINTITLILILLCIYHLQTLSQKPTTVVVTTTPLPPTVTSSSKSNSLHSKSPSDNTRANYSNKGSPSSPLYHVYKSPLLLNYYFIIYRE